MFAAGDLVVYGGEGVCRVESIGPSVWPMTAATRSTIISLPCTAAAPL